MNNSVNELEEIITNNLLSINSLKNDIENKNNEQYDQLKAISLCLIDIIDSFERIQESLSEKYIDKSNEAYKIINRYTTIQKKIMNILYKYGITKIEFPDNRLIVGLCEVIDTQPSNNKKNDEIISIVRNGYIRGKELIRSAQIIVVKN